MTSLSLVCIRKGSSMFSGSHFFFFLLIIFSSHPLPLKLDSNNPNNLDTIIQYFADEISPVVTSNNQLQFMNNEIIPKMAPHIEEFLMDDKFSFADIQPALTEIAMRVMETGDKICDNNKLNDDVIERLTVDLAAKAKDTPLDGDGSCFKEDTRASGNPIFSK